MPTSRASQSAKAAPVVKAGAADAVIVCAFKGTEAKMRALWQRATGDESIRVVPVEAPDGGDRFDLIGVLSSLAGDEGVTERFTLVPPNTFPAKAVTPEELRLCTVYVSKGGKISHFSCLPLQFVKADVREFLEGGLDAEQLCDAQIDRITEVPVWAGYSFGNLVTPVLHANPCESVILEAFVRRKYVAPQSRGAWDAIEHLVDRLLPE